MICQIVLAIKDDPVDILEAVPELGCESHFMQQWKQFPFL